MILILQSLLLTTRTATVQTTHPALFAFSQYSRLRHCATRRKVAGSIPDGNIGNFSFK